MTEPNVNEKKYRVSEFAIAANIGRTKAWQMVRDREICSYKIAGKVWIPESALSEFLKKSFRPAFDAEKEAHGILTKHRKTSIQKTAVRKCKGL